MFAIVPNTDYFKLKILKVKTFIYDTNNKIIYKFCIREDSITRREGKVTGRGRKFSTLVFLCRTSQKLMAAPRVCDN